jgi:homoserine dehydrogenase
VDRRGIAHVTPERLADLDRRGKAMVLIARGRRGPDGVKLRVRPEVLDRTDPFAALEGTTNLLRLHTDLMGTIGICSVRPGVKQTAYGVFADVVDIARSV